MRRYDEIETCWTCVGPLHACGREPVGLGLRLPCSMASPRGAVRAVLPVLPLLPRLTMWSSPAGFSDGRGPAGLCPVAVQRRSSTGCHCSDTRRSLSNSRTGSINMTRCPVGVVLRLRRIGDRYLEKEVVADIAHLMTAVPRS